jgi:hypothetical protein
MNGYCSEKTPKTDYFLFYIIGQAIVLVGPHFLWQSWFSGRLTHFITVALSLKLHREDDTGDYVQDNFSRVQSLRKSFGKSITIHWLYFAKLIMQLLCCAGACVCSWVPFYELEYTTLFHPVFHCHYTGPVTDFLELEDYIFNVTCVVPALRSHFAVWITNFILLGGNAICLCFAVVWWVIPHAVLNWKEASMFSMQSGIEPHHYSKRCSFSYTMKTDLDFLLLRLYGQDEGHGTVMREILIISTMKDLMHKAKENLNLMKEAKKDQLISEDAQSQDSLGSYLVQLTQQRFQSTSMTAVDLSFGTEGYSIALAKICNRVISINLDHHYLNTGLSAVRRSFNSGIHTIRTKSDIYAQPDPVSQQFSDEFIIRVLNKKKTEGQAKNTIKLFVIAPFSDPDRVMTVHWFMFFLKRGRIVDEEAVLIVVRPLTIGSRDVSGQFEKFEPIWPWEEQHEGTQTRVFRCGGTFCNFSISMYKVDKSAIF